MSKELEESTKTQIDFGKIKDIARKGQKVIPAVVQNPESKEVLMLGYVNEQALKKSLEMRKVVLWSTSRNELWIKGETSGNFLNLIEARINCEQNSILFLAVPEASGACHTHLPDGEYRKSCYYRKLGKNGRLAFIQNPK